MPEPFLGEIRIFAGTFAPAGWMFCQGQLLQISSNLPLFQLIGKRYGGDGELTFALPDLRGRIPIHVGNGFALADAGGVETVTLTVSQIPAHNHPLKASLDIATQSAPQNNVTGQAAAKIYRSGSPSVLLNPGSVAVAGGSQPHDNLQPFLCISFIIAVEGDVPRSS